MTIRSEFITDIPDEICCELPHYDLETVDVSLERCQQYRILCVDDEIIGTTMRAEILREHGYSLTVDHSPLAVALRSLDVRSRNSGF
jgi:hypothetical protein